jgi:hypothetical protein
LVDCHPTPGFCSTVPIPWIFLRVSLYASRVFVVLSERILYPDSPDANRSEENDSRGRRYFSINSPATDEGRLAILATGETAEVWINVDTRVACFCHHTRTSRASPSAFGALETEREAAEPSTIRPSDHTRAISSPDSRFSRNQFDTSATVTHAFGMILRVFLVGEVQESVLGHDGHARNSTFVFLASICATISLETLSSIVMIGYQSDRATRAFMRTSSLEPRVRFHCGERERRVFCS